MTTLYKWCITLVVCTLVGTYGVAQTVAITSSQEANSSFKMDEAWKSVVTAAGYTAEIHPITFLGHSDLRSTTDLIIISNGTGNIDLNYRSNILKFIRAGGHIYIQSEYLSTFDGNELFKYLLEKTGSAFEWGGQTEYNIGPMNIINGFETELEDNTLDYFWYGTHGCGDGQVNPFIEVNGDYYAFYYRSSNTAIGNIITNSDHDWIRRIDDNRAPREALMTKIVEVLFNGLSMNNYQHPTITFQEDINFCSANTISVEVQNTTNPVIQWYLNEMPTESGTTIDITNFVDGDSLRAELSINTGCVTSTSTTESIAVTKQSYNPSFTSRFNEVEPICPGSTVYLEVTFDESLPNIRHNWFLNGKDTPIKTEYFTSDNLNNGDFIEHTITYFNGCEDIVMATQGSIIIEWKDVTVPNFQIQGQSQFCTPSTAFLSLPSLNIDNSIIQWHVDNVLTAEDQLNIEIEASEIQKEVFATIRYYDTCSGWVTISTPIINVRIEIPEIYLGEKANHDCIHGEGFIEVYGNLSDLNYTWSNGQSGNYISDLSEGIFTVTATSSTGCITTEQYEISKLIFPLLDTFNIRQPDCTNGTGSVNLELAQNNLSDINVRWINSEGEIVSTSQTTDNLATGTYQIVIDANGNCEERYDITIDEYRKEQHIHIDTLIVELGEETTLRPNMTGYEDRSIEWQAHPDLSCTSCLNPKITPTTNHLFNYYLQSDGGCTIQKAVLVLLKIRDPFYAPSGFSPNNDGINDYYKILPRPDVFPTSSLLIFDRWGSLIHEEQSDTRGWDGKSFGQLIQKGIYVYVQNFEDIRGKKYIAKGSITIFN